MCFSFSQCLQNEWGALEPGPAGRVKFQQVFQRGRAQPWGWGGEAVNASALDLYSDGRGSAGLGSGGIQVEFTED